MFSAKRRQPWDALAAPQVSSKGSGQFADHNMVLLTQDPVGFLQTALTKRLDASPIFFFLMKGLVDYAYILSTFGRIKCSDIYR